MIGGELLGLAEGLALAGAAEFQDIVAAAWARQSDIYEAEKQGLLVAEGKLKTLKQLEASQQASQQTQQELSSTGGGEATTEEQASVNGGLRERYGQMCKWTLEGIE